MEEFLLERSSNYDEGCLVLRSLRIHIQYIRTYMERRLSVSIGHRRKSTTSSSLCGALLLALVSCCWVVLVVLVEETHAGLPPPPVPVPDEFIGPSIRAISFRGTVDQSHQNDVVVFVRLCFECFYMNAFIPFETTPYWLWMRITANQGDSDLGGVPSMSNAGRVVRFVRQRVPAVGLRTRCRGTLLGVLLQQKLFCHRRVPSGLQLWRRLRGLRFPCCHQDLHRRRRDSPLAHRYALLSLPVRSPSLLIAAYE